MLFVVENKQPITRRRFATKIQSYVFDVVIIGLVGLSTLSVLMIIFIIFCEFEYCVMMFRQDNLWYNWGFRCCCEVCKEEEINVDHIKTYQKYENLQREVRKCLENQKNQDRKSRLENIKKEVSYHKGMWFLFGTLSVFYIFA